MIVAITFITCPGTNFTVEQLSVSRRASGGFAALTAEIIPLMWARPNTVKRPDRAAGQFGISSASDFACGEADEG